jgi:hypothetical protein
MHHIGLDTLANTHTGGLEKASFAGMFILPEIPETCSQLNLLRFMGAWVRRTGRVGVKDIGTVSLSFSFTCRRNSVNDGMSSFDLPVFLSRKADSLFCSPQNMDLYRLLMRIFK